MATWQSITATLFAALEKPVSSTKLNKLPSNLLFLFNAPSARAYNNANLSVANGTLTVLNLNSERWDNDGIHSTSTNTSRMTAQTAGVYVVSGSVIWATNTTGDRQLFIRLNGTDYMAGGLAQPRQQRPAPDGRHADQDGRGGLRRARRLPVLGRHPDHHRRRLLLPGVLGDVGERRMSGRLPPGLPALLRNAGLTVVEVPGWQTRGAPTLDPRVILRHHTAGPSGGGDLPTRGVLVNGRSDLPGPLCQIGLGRSGTCYVIAAGKANHAGAGSWLGITGNTHALGVEAENDGRQPWPAEQLAAWDVLDVVLLRLIGQPASHLCAHREWAPRRKTDPHSLPMDAVRDRVARLLHGTAPNLPRSTP